MVRVYAVTSNRGQSSVRSKLCPTKAFQPVPEYWIVLTLLSPMAAADACRTACASCAEPEATTNVSSATKVNALRAMRDLLSSHKSQVSSHKSQGSITHCDLSLVTCALYVPPMLASRRLLGSGL